jgi:hypothetical protein
MPMSEIHIHIWVRAQVVWTGQRLEVIHYKRCRCGKILF